MDMKKAGLLMILFLAASGLWAQNQDRDLFTEAENRFSQKAWEAALERYSRLLQDFPLSVFAGEAVFRSGLSNLQLTRWDEALRQFSTAAQRWPDAAFAPEIPYWQAVTQLEAGRPREALPLLDAILKPTGPLRLKAPALLAQARASTALEDWPAARRQLEALAQDEGEGFWNQEYAVTLYFNALSRLKDWDSLTAAAGKITFKPGKAALERLNFWKAEALTAKGRTAEARPLYQALEDSSDPVASIVYQRLFNQYLEAGDRGALEALLSKAGLKLAGNPALLAEFRIRAGILAYKQGQWAQAEAALSQVWSQWPGQAVPGVVPFYLSLLKDKAGQSAAGLELLRRYLGAPGPDNAELLLLQQGKLEAGLGQWSEAQATFTRLLTSWPDSPDAGRYRLWQSLAAAKRAPDLKTLELVRANQAAARDAGLDSWFLKIRTGLENKLGLDDQALAGLKAYLPLAPGDVRARLDYAGLLLQKKRWAEALAALAPVDAGLKNTDPAGWFQYRFFSGLALTGLGRFAEAKDPLTEVAKSAAASAADFKPYAAFYLGWALIKINPPDFAAAATAFGQVASEWPGHSLRPRALWQAGTAALNARLYPQAETWFRQLLQTAQAWSPEFQAPLQLARVLAAQGKTDEARKQLTDIGRRLPAVGFAAEAAFELARLWEKDNNLPAAAEAYKAMARQFPASPLAEEALYHRGEILFAQGDWTGARDAYNDYRTAWPKGRWGDAALYWSGEASLALKENFAAALVWITLADSWPDSRLRAPALKKTAEVYFAAGDYKTARQYLKDLQAADAVQAKALGAQERLDQIELMLKGQTEEEARLIVSLNKNKRAQSPEGRKAMVDLARLYLFEDGRRLGEAKTLLEEVLRGPEDGDVQARAQYFLGEYWYRSSDLPRAGQEFLKVRSFKPTDKDLTASSLYRAAEMILYAGNRDQAKQIIDALEKAFPKSDWVLQGRKLLGGQP